MFYQKNEKDIEFTRIPESEDCEGLLSGDHRQAPSKSLRSSGTSSWLLNSIALILVSIVSAILGVWAYKIFVLDADNLSIRHISQYSPIMRDVGVRFHWVQFNGSLLATNVFRQDSGPEVDAAWKSLGADYHAARIPTSEAAHSGLANDQVKIKEKYGGGFPAHVEGLHHLHCLNLLRKSLAWNFDYYQTQGLGPFSNSPIILKSHVTHCLDILRQQLMCTVDVGVLGQVWYQPPNKPPESFVDFNTMHKCRNFEEIRHWAEQHQLPEETPEDFLQGPEEGDRIWHEVP